MEIVSGISYFPHFGGRLDLSVLQDMMHDDA